MFYFGAASGLFDEIRKYFRVHREKRPEMEVLRKKNFTVSAVKVFCAGTSNDLFRSFKTTASKLKVLTDLFLIFLFPRLSSQSKVWLHFFRFFVLSFKF